MREHIRTSLNRLVDGNLRRLTAFTSFGISIAGVVLLAIIAFAGTSANESATERERTLLQNALNRGIARALNEQKSVAWWDDAIIKITDTNIDWQFADSNFGVFLTETYGQDEVYIINGEEKPLYAYSNGKRAEPSAFELRRADVSAVLAELHGDHTRKLKLRPDAFGEEQRDYNVLSAVVDIASWAGHILSIDQRLVIVTAMTIVPNQDVSILKGAPNILISLTYLDDNYISSMGKSLLLDNLKITAIPTAGEDTVSEPFEGDDGAHAGYLSWTTQRPGKVLLKTILPLVAVGVLAAAALAAGMLRRLKAASAVLADRERQSRRDALHDALSGLPNRPHFAGQLKTTLERAATGPDGGTVVVAYIDIDRFKDVNDTLGHHAGDDLIKAVASRLSNMMRRETTLARYGGDEFAVLWSVKSADAANALAERIKRIFSDRFEIDGQSLRVTASAGIAVDSSGTAKAEDLMRQADIALYEAKAQGRDRSVLFTEDMASRVEERLAIESDLRTALETNQLRLNYQPIMASSTGTISGVEALLRWRHPARGEISPGVFIPIAEQSGLMPALGEWVLSQAMRDSHQWPDLQVSVNLSPVQFRQVDLESLLLKMLAKHNVKASQFVLEITEGVLMESSDRTSRTLDSIHAMGFLTALDDFGTGYSSLAYLCNFRFDKIKIDRAFVAGMSKSVNYKKIVNAIVSLGKGMGMDIVAEGVETETEVQVMTALGCTELQGFYFSKPLEVAALLALRKSFVPYPAISRKTDGTDQPRLAQAV